MNRFVIAAAVASVLSLSSLFTSPADAANVHKTVIVHPNGNVTKKFAYGPVHPHHHHNHGYRPSGVIVKSNGVILRTPVIGIRIGR